MLPKNWDDITLEQYVAVYKTLSEEPKGEDGDWNLLIKRVCLLTNKEPGWVEDNLTLNDLQKMQEFLKTPLPQKLIRSFRFNGKRYKVDINPTKYDAGRYMSVMNQLKENKVDNLHKVMFQICREVNWYGKTVEKDLGKLHEEIESLKQLPMKIVNPISVFFCLLSEHLMNDILRYSTEQMNKAKEDLQMEIDYLADMAG